MAPEYAMYGQFSVKSGYQTICSDGKLVMDQVLNFGMTYGMGRRTSRQHFPDYLVWLSISLAINKDVSIKEMVLIWQKDHDLIWRRRLRGWELESEQAIEMVVKNIKLDKKSDRLEWLGNNGQLITKDIYQKKNHGKQLSGMWALI